MYLFFSFDYYKLLCHSLTHNQHGRHRLKFDYDVCGTVLDVAPNIEGGDRTRFEKLVAIENLYSRHCLRHVE